MNDSVVGKPDYGIDAPKVLRNLFLAGGLCLVLGMVLPPTLQFGPVKLMSRPTFLGPAAILLLEGCLYLLYVKVGKFHHRDFILSLYRWRGNEQVLDVGCGRGLLLAGAAKRLNAGGHATGIDIWSTEDLSGNAEAATQQNLEVEGVVARCTVMSQSATEMRFADASFDVVVSNLCLHNITDKAARRVAVGHIARVLRPGGVAMISDYKNTGEYASELRRLGLEVEKKRKGMLTTFPPLTVVAAQKPL